MMMMMMMIEQIFTMQTGHISHSLHAEHHAKICLNQPSGAIWRITLTVNKKVIKVMNWQ